jgi:hypothetical protein
MRSSRREDNSHYDVLPVRLDEELNERERERLRVTTMSLDPLLFRDGAQPVRIAHPCCYDRGVGHSASKVLIVGSGPLLDQHKGGSIVVLGEQAVNRGAYRTQGLVAVRLCEVGNGSGCQGELTVSRSSARKSSCLMGALLAGG